MAANPDTYRAYNFKLLIGGAEEGHFTECSGLNVKVDVIKYRESGNSQVVQAVPGQVDYGDITLKYGLTASHVLWDWMMTAVKGAVERKNVSIVMLDSAGSTEVMRWNLNDAWPCEWSGAPLNALNHEVAIETLRLAFTGLERA